jgi:hypothetical protein
MIEQASLRVMHTLFTDIASALAQQRLIEHLDVRCVVSQMGADAYPIT